MGIRKFKPTSPGTRFRSGSDFAELTTDTPYKPLMRPIKRTGGR
ncbi:MAG: 50S ribosomal protein L2, partial [Nitrospirota bacterium]|nr:50S ribosomal protein L2 [Nitrospirota bacterium]